MCVVRFRRLIVVYGLLFIVDCLLIFALGCLLFVSLVIPYLRWFVVYCVLPIVCLFVCLVGCVFCAHTVLCIDYCLLRVVCFCWWGFIVYCLLKVAYMLFVVVGCVLPIAYCYCWVLLNAYCSLIAYC